MQLITQWNTDIQQISKVSAENNDETSAQEST